MRLVIAVSSVDRDVVDVVGPRWGRASFESDRDRSRALGGREQPFKLTGKTNGWKQILNALTVHYGDRIVTNHQRPSRPFTQRIGHSPRPDDGRGEFIAECDHRFRHREDRRRLCRR